MAKQKKQGQGQNQGQGKKVPKQKIQQRLKLFDLSNYHIGFISPKPSQEVWDASLKTVKSGVITSRNLLPYFVVLIFNDKEKQKAFEHELLEMEAPIARSEKNRLVVNLKAYIDLLQYKIPLQVVIDKFVPALKEAELFADEINFEVKVKDKVLGTIKTVSHVADRELVVVEVPYPEVLQRTSLCTYTYQREKSGVVTQKFHAVLRGLPTVLHVLGTIAAVRFGKLVDEYNKQKNQILQEIQDKLQGVTKPHQEASEVIENPKEAIEMLKDLL